MASLTLVFARLAREGKGGFQELRLRLGGGGWEGTRQLPPG